MIRILFVDDDPLILAGLQRRLRGRCPDWQMDFVANGAEALKRLAESKFDAVVSDMCMPEMDGIELLAEAKRHHPDALRLLLSGLSAEELGLRGLGTFHECLAKPCDLDLLQDAVSRNLALRESVS